MKRCKKCKTKIVALTCQKCGGTDYEIVYDVVRDNPFLDFDEIQSSKLNLIEEKEK